MKPRNIAILAVPGVQLLDVSGPLDVFAEANLQSGTEAYRPCRHRQLRTAISAAPPVCRLVADYTIEDEIGPLDTLLVAGCPSAAETRPRCKADFIAPARSRQARRRYGSVCSGAFLLAAAGLLDGRRVTTHWAVAERLGGGLSRR